MTLPFWLLAALLLLGVLAVLLWPLLRPDTRAGAAVDATTANVQILRDQLDTLDAEHRAGEIDAAELARARDEIERRVLADVAPNAATQGAVTQRASGGALALLVALPGLALALYMALGNLDALDPLLRQPAHEADAHDVEQLVERLAGRMREHPEDAEGWALLGRAYASMQRFEPARDALAQAVQRRADDAQLRADYADMLAMAQGRDLQGEPERQVGLALQTDPDNLKALALAGSAAMQRGDAATALRHWQRARGLIGDDHPLSAGLDAGLLDARAQAAGPAPAAATGERAQAPAPAASLHGQVRLAPELLAQVKPGDTLFVFARAAEGPRAPLAVQRGLVGSWPVAYTLDDSMAMAAALRLSSFERVVVVARISRSGQAGPRSGDLEGRSEPVRPGQGPVHLTIDRVLP